MKDYEVLRIPNGRNPNMGLLHLTVSERRVGLRIPVLNALGRPDGIVIHRGIKANEGKLIIEAADYDEDNPIDEIIFIDYERKKIDFFNRDFVEICKEMIRKYGRGEFTKGVYFTVKGVQESENIIMFDFHIVSSHIVTAVQKPKKRGANSKTTGKRSLARNIPTEIRKVGESRSGQPQAQQSAAPPYGSASEQTQAISGFRVPAMAKTF